MSGSFDDFLAEISAIAPKKSEPPKTDVLISKPPEGNTPKTEEISEPPPPQNQTVPNTSGEPVVPQPPKKYNFIKLIINREKNEKKGAKPKKPEKLDYKKVSKRKFYRIAGGEKWFDPTLQEWPEDDFRVFVGNLGNEVDDERLKKTFAHYKSVAKVKVIRDKRNLKTKGFGFVSFLDPEECLKALKEMNNQYCGNKPMNLKISQWKKRSQDVAKKDWKEQQRKLSAMTKKSSVDIFPE